VLGKCWFNRGVPRRTCNWHNGASHHSELPDEANELFRRRVRQQEKLTRRKRFLAEIEAATPWSALVAALLPYYPKGDGRGRPPLGLERMLRMYIAQQCFGLSDEGIEDAIYDSQSGIRRHRSDARIGAGCDHAAEVPSAAGKAQPDAPDLR